MPFPEFEAGNKKILFFSRGRGRGHAIPDMEMVKELVRLREDVQVRFVSYGTGARTIEECGFPLIDLGLPDFNGIAETTVLAGKLIAWLEPDLVVSHEEFPALPAAKIFDKRTVLITDWFTGPASYSMQSLRFADRRRGDSKELYYVAPDRTVMAVPVSGTDTEFNAGKPAPLLQANFRGTASNVNRNFAVAKDGERFLLPVYETRPGEWPLRAVLNWHLELQEQARW